MSAGAFATWQPRYAEMGIATFPVVNKTPAIRGYLKLKPGGSSKLVARFPEATAFGLALKPSGITVVDVDTPNERVLADALARHGDTPFIVQSGSGHFQAWYRGRDEGRSIRPDPGIPIDILGDGFVVAPPSVGEKGTYRIIQGTLNDLAALPSLLNPPESRRAFSATQGRRNDELWRYCMQQAHYCDNLEALLDVARTANGNCLPPLADVEVVRVAESAWQRTQRGENWFGSGRLVPFTHDELDTLLERSPDAFVLLAVLRRRHWGRNFFIANAMSAHMPGRWTEKRLARARRDLVSAGKIEMVRPAGKGRGPAIYRLKQGWQPMSCGSPVA